MAGVDVHQRSTRGIEAPEDACQIRHTRVLRVDLSRDAREQLRGMSRLARERSKERVRRCLQQRCGNAFSRDVADDKEAAGVRNEVVEIASDVKRGLQSSG